MKLTFDQIKSITLGAARVTEEEKGFRFYRFTEQQDAYYRAFDDFYYKTFSGSGILLEFVTNSSRISLETDISFAASRKFAFHDLYSNGTLIGRLGSCDTETGVFGGSYSLGEGIKTVQLYFPWSSKTYLRYVELDDGATVIPVPRPKKMLIYGDSITQGYDALYPSRCYATVLAQGLNAEARNKGIGGEVFVPDMLSPEGDDFIPDYITVAYGTNDWWIRPDRAAFLAPMREFYKKLSAMYPNAKIFALTPLWRTDKDEKRPACRFEEIPELIKEATEGLSNVTVINGYQLVPHDKACYRDGLHPNDTGSAYFAERLLASILPHLK